MRRQLQSCIDFLTFSVFALIWLFSSLAHSKDTMMQSPDGRLQAQLKIANWHQHQRVPTFTIGFAGRDLVVDGLLNLDFRGSGALRNLVLEEQKSKLHDSTYTMTVGRNGLVRDHYREYEFSLRESSVPRRRLKIIFRPLS